MIVDVCGFELTGDQISFKMETQAVTGRNFYPSVTEPSFGRLRYCLWERCYYVREDSEDAKRAALSKNEHFNPRCASSAECWLAQAGLINRVDDGGRTIG